MDWHDPESPPRHVTPSHYTRRARYGYSAGYHGRSRPPLVYQIHGNVPHPSDNPYPRGHYPGGFSPIRPTTVPLYSPQVSPPSDNDSLYASFSPPRRTENKSRTEPHAIQPSHSEQSYSPAIDRSIFRPKQSSVLVRTEHSNDESSVTCGSRQPSGPSPSPAPVNRGWEASTQVLRNGTASFPMRLHEILSSPEYKEYIVWLPHGRAFRVLRPKAFEEDVLPKYFRSTKYASFMRQVNGWGFKRITQPGPDFNAYWHELFLRGLPDFCAKMRRPQKSEMEGAKAAATEDPNFYRMPPLPKSGSSSSEHEEPEVDRSASMSSVSCEVLAKEHRPSLPRSGCAQGINQNLSRNESWDNGKHPHEVAVNLGSVYDDEVSKPKPGAANQLSEADLHYLLQQNRALLREAKMNQSRAGHR